MISREQAGHNANPHFLVCSGGVFRLRASEDEPVVTVLQSRYMAFQDRLHVIRQFLGFGHNTIVSGESATAIDLCSLEWQNVSPLRVLFQSLLPRLNDPLLQALPMS